MSKGEWIRTVGGSYCDLSKAYVICMAARGRGDTYDVTAFFPFILGNGVAYETLKKFKDQDEADIFLDEVMTRFGIFGRAAALEFYDKVLKRSNEATEREDEGGYVCPKCNGLHINPEDSLFDYAIRKEEEKFLKN